MSEERPNETAQVRSESEAREMSEQRQHISAEEARGAEIILRTRAMRIIFIAGLVAFAVLAIVLSY